MPNAIYIVYRNFLLSVILLGLLFFSGLPLTVLGFVIAFILIYNVQRQKVTGRVEERLLRRLTNFFLSVVLIVSFIQVMSSFLNYLFRLL